MLRPIADTSPLSAYRAVNELRCHAKGADSAASWKHAAAQIVIGPPNVLSLTRAAGPRAEVEAARRLPRLKMFT
jgi:hypothetical protein